MDAPDSPRPHPGPNPSPGEQKTALRQAVRDTLARMHSEARGRASARVCELINASEWMRSASCLMVFDALADEPDLSAVAAAALARGKTVCYPRIDWDRRVLTPVAVPDLGFVRTTARHGVREPRDGRELHASGVDLVIVPGVAFDAHGARLGRGGGFYDRFLGGLVERVEASGATAVGACFECQRVERVPREAHDVRVDAVVTERGVFRAAAGGAGG